MINKKLNQLNFNKLLILDTNIDKYDFNQYLINKNKHPIKGFCVSCEKLNYNLSNKDENFKLKNISHGATSFDFISAVGNNNIDFSTWKKDGIIFLMEGPGADGGFYDKITFDTFEKKPSREWYWVHNKQKECYFPENFKGKVYGELFNSIIFTFKLQNAYFTNLVKCGLNDESNGFKNIEGYNEKCLQNCSNLFLKEEYKIINPKLIFCFGERVKENVKILLPDYKGVSVFLPHPMHRTLSSEYFKYLYFTKILEGLYKSEIYTKNETSEKFIELINKNEKT